MLQAELPLAALRERLVPMVDFRPYPTAAERASWTALLDAPINRDRFHWLIGQAEALATQPWPVLSASLYMEFARTGNRTHYEAPYFERRTRLGQLVVAECMEHDGRWLDAICDGLWCLLGEPTWCLPAHAHRHPNDPLPNPDGTEIDLFACDTGYLVAEILYLLGPELRAHSPSIVLRLEREMERRIFAHFESRTIETCWWFNGGNNWAPWCASNIAGAACYMLADTDRLATILDSLNAVVDRFIANYGDDGGCDEGPGYWTKAAGAMYDYFVRVEHRLGQSLEIFDHPKIRAMGEFYFTAQLHENWLLDFADAPAKGGAPPALVYGFGERIGSRAMMDLALAAQRTFTPNATVSPRLTARIGGLNMSLNTLFRLPTEWTPVPIRKPLSTWLPDVQVAVLRSSDDSGHGLVLGAKGGHNAESHNHNDVGNFLLMLDGQPGIVDVGTAEYSRKTFSAERYSIWYIRGAAHNAPVVNGVEQAAGREFAARDVSLTEDDGVTTLRLELADAYPQAAQLRSLTRVFRFDRAAERLTVTDEAQFASSGGRLDYRFYSQATAVRAGGSILITTAPRQLTLQATGATWDEPALHHLDDPLLNRTWGDQLWASTAHASCADDRLTVTFTIAVAG